MAVCVGVDSGALDHFEESGRRPLLPLPPPSPIPSPLPATFLSDADKVAPSSTVVYDADEIIDPG